MTLKILNTLGRRKEPFIPLREGTVHIYVCGPTVYDYIHIGNARAFVVADVVRRYLEYKGYRVKLVSNITDVDDKSIRRSREMGISLQQLGEIYSDAYFEDIRRLNIKKPDVNPRATQHISEIIDLIQKLLDKGYAYQVNGEIYYDISKFKDYGKLSGNRAEALRMGARIEVNPKKRNPADFALWKRRKDDEPAWHSPWGPGRPGWHIECSAMAMKYLGETFDIHMGGKDLIFPHHENEIAQSEAATGKPFARYWLHNEWLTVNGRKMSKSLGNYITVREALERYDPLTLRFFLASAHYRSPLDLNEENIKQSGRILERIMNAVRRLRDLKEQPEPSRDDEHLLEAAEEARRRFEEAMDDDFNTPLATSAIIELTKKINLFIEEKGTIHSETKSRVLEIINKLLEVLGVEEKATDKDVGSAGLIMELVNLIMEVRERMRKRRDWETADMIRDRLRRLGFTVEDTPEGSRWSITPTKQ